MRQAPLHRVDRRAIYAWRMHQIILIVVLLLAMTAAAYVMDYLEWPVWISIAGFMLILSISPFSIYFGPQWEWTYTRYEITEKEVYLQSGRIFIERTIIPMIRIQHVESAQGPILRKYGLANLKIHTAGGGSFTIRALSMEEADQLRDRIGSWVRVEDDV